MKQSNSLCEQILGQHPCVHEAVVITDAQEGHEQRVVAYIVPIPQEHPTVNELLAFLAEQMPRDTLPAEVVLLDSLPLAPGGEVDRQALPDPGLTEGTMPALASEETARQIAGSDPRAQVLILQSGGSRRPFFFVYGDWSGGGAYVWQLARMLGPDQPFYGLAPYEFDRAQVPLSFEAVAAAHIAALRMVQSEGPYVLGGFCNGGLLAYEMARQLHAQGQEVTSVILVDPATPYSHRTLRRLISRLGMPLRLDPNTQVNCFLRYLYARIPSYRVKVQASARQSADPQKPAAAALLFPSAAALRSQWSGIYRWVEAGYVPGRYPGKLTVVWSSEAFAQRIDWSRISGGSEVEEQVFAGSHYSCKNVNLPVVAERLKACLAQVQEAASG